MPPRTNARRLYCGKRCRQIERQADKVAVYQTIRAEEISGRRCQICKGPIPHGRFRGAKFCSRKCEKSLENPAQRLKFKKICPHCKKSFHPIRATQVYCGHKCAGRAASLAGRNLPPPSGPPRGQISCEICGKVVLKKERGTKYCSRACWHHSQRVLTVERFDRLLGIIPPRPRRFKLTARRFDIVLEKMRPKRALRYRLTAARFDRLCG